jgi:UDP-glucose 4-epimerase
MRLKNKTVLITGGAGFIGSHLAERVIQEGAEKVTVLDNLFLGRMENLKEAYKANPSLEFIKADMASMEGIVPTFDKESIDVVFDLAVIPLPASLDRPAWTFRHNLDMTLNICELARLGKFKTLVHFSSSETYGTSVYAPMDEGHPLNGSTTYASSKAASDLLINSYHKMYGIDCSIIRPFNNYGPRQNDGSYAGVIPITIKRLLKGEQPVIYGDGEQTRDFLYVTDTAKAAVDVYMEKKTRGLTLNVARGVEISINEVVRTICKHMGYTGKIIYEDERPGDVRRHIANIFLARDIIDFKPVVDFSDGMAQTIDWYLRKNVKK